MYKNFCILRSYCSIRFWTNPVISESNLLFQLFRSIDRTWKRERSVGFDEITRGGRTGFFPSPPVSRWWEARGVELWRVRTTWEEVLERSGVGLIVLFFCLILFRDILSFLSFLTPSSSSSQAWKHRFRGIPPDFIGHLIPVGEFNFLKILLEI